MTRRRLLEREPRGRPTDEKKIRRTVHIEPSLWDYAVNEARRTALREKRYYSASDWLRDAMRLRMDADAEVKARKRRARDLREGITSGGEGGDTT